MTRRAGALALVLLLSLPALAQAPICSVCGQRFTRGFQLEDGRKVCAADLDKVSPHCTVCQATIRGNYRVVGEREAPVCDACFDGYPHCFACGLPAAQGSQDLKDGRVLCAFDRKTAVFSDEQAARLFQQAQDEVLKTFGRRLALGVGVGGVHLVDQPTMIGLMEGIEVGGYHRAASGLTRIRAVHRGGKRTFEPPQVYLLTGLPRSRFLTVAAHEYAHAWHSQRHPDYRTTTRRMREGFAEWVALKVAQKHDRDDETRALLGSADPDYSEGLRACLAIEKKKGVRGVLDYALREVTLP